MPDTNALGALIAFGIFVAAVGLLWLYTLVKEWFDREPTRYAPQSGRWRTRVLKENVVQKGRGPNHR